MTVADTQPKIGSCTEAVATVAAFRQDAWAKQDPHIHNNWPTLTPEWRYDDTLRADYASCQDLGKVDLLAAKALLTLNHLQTIYHVRPPAMRQYEATWCKHGEWPARAQDHKIHARDTTGKLDSFST